MTKINDKKTRGFRKTEAEERAAAREARSDEQQLDELDKRVGPKGARRERGRLGKA